MAGDSFQPYFNNFAALRKEPAKGSHDPNAKAGEEQAKATEDQGAESTDELTISMYQDPRDALDLERHQRGGITGKPARR